MRFSGAAVGGEPDGWGGGIWRAHGGRDAGLELDGFGVGRGGGARRAFLLGSFWLSGVVVVEVEFCWRSRFEGFRVRI